MTSKVALITGITGMDGTLLANFLLSKGYKIVGLFRNKPTNNFSKIDGVTYIESDLFDLDAIDDLLFEYKFDEIYNLGAQTFIDFSWKHPEYTLKVNGLSVIKFLNYIKNNSPKTKFFNASSSEVFDGTLDFPQNENTLYSPKNPYGTSKTFANNMIKNYREKYKIFACSGILYTHESTLRNDHYVSKKITNGVAKIHLGISNKIILGDIEATRDWLSAKDVIVAMWMILQQDTPDDYIVSSGITRKVKDFLSCAFNVIGINDWEKYVTIEQDLIRPKEPIKIVGNNLRLTSIGWSPKISFNQMIEEMVLFDIKKLKYEKN